MKNKNFLKIGCGSLLALNLALILASCSTGSLGSSSVSSGSSEKEFQLRSFQEETLPNGLKIIFVQDDTLPRVSLGMVVKVGSNQDPAGQEGLGHLTGWLLEDGTTHRSALRLADDFAYLGTEINASVTHETTSIGASSLASERKKLLDLFADVMLSPAYSQRELERKKEQTISSLKRMIDNPSAYADHLLDETLFAQHPYGRLVMGTPEAVKKISKSDLIKHYFKYYRPNNSILAVVGALDENFKKQVRSAFQSWQSKDFEKDAVVPLAENSMKNLRLVSKSGLKQAQIRLGHLGIQRTDPDFLKLRLANVVLGGAFASRLNQRVRDDLGLTYSISSQFDARKDRGSLEISTFSRNDKTAQAIKETLSEFKKFADDGITSKELESAKALLVGQFPAAIETSDRLAYNLMVLRYYGIPDSYLNDFIKNVKAITLKEVNEAIKRHYNPKDLKVVVFADQATVLDQLKTINEVKIEQAVE